MRDKASNIRNRVTRADIENDPHFREASVVAKTNVEDRFLPEARKYRGWWKWPAVIAGAAIYGAAEYFSGNDGSTTKEIVENSIEYISLGALSGWGINRVLGTVLYEWLGEDGDIRNLFRD